MEEKKTTHQTSSGIVASSVEQGLGSSISHLIKDPRKSPFLRRDNAKPTSNNDTLIHLAKGSLGAGVLAMPYAFSNAGLALGTIGIIVIGFICTYCVHIMVNAGQELCWRHDMPTIEFGQIAELGMQGGPKATRHLSVTARKMITTFLTLGALSACCVYVVFVSENLSLVLNIYIGKEVNLKLYILAVTVVLMMLSMVRNLKNLAPLSMLSNVLILSSIIIIFTYVFEDLPTVSERPAFVSINRLPVFFSTAVFALEGITVIMPLENSMKTPKSFLGCFNVLNTAMTLIVCIYAMVGFFGFLKYGEEIEGSISLNLPSEEGLAQAVQINLAIAIAFTYPLQFYCAIDFTWPTLSAYLEQRMPSMSGLKGEYLYRVILVLLTMCVALAIPNLSALMGLIGAVCLTTLGIIFPPVLETLVFWDNLGAYKWRLWKNIIIFAFGVLGFITGLYTSIVDIIESF